MLNLDNLDKLFDTIRSEFATLRNPANGPNREKARAAIFLSLVVILCTMLVLFVQSNVILLQAKCEGGNGSICSLGASPQADCEDGSGPICGMISSPQADCEDGSGPICGAVSSPQADCEDGSGPICGVVTSTVN